MDRAQHVRAHEKVAARVVVHVAAHAPPEVAVAVPAAHEHVLVDTSAGAREEPVARRRHAGAAHAADRRVAEVLHRVLEPARVGVGVVVDERHHVAPCGGNAGVALLGRPHLAGRNHGEGKITSPPRRLGRGVGQHDDLEVAVGLLGEAFQAFVEHPRPRGTRDHHAHERVLLQRRRHFHLRVVVQHAEAVEDGERVVHHLAHGARLERAELLAEADLHGRLAHLRAASVGDGEELEVERVRLHEHAVERVAEHLPAEELHARLRVGDGQPHHEAHEAEVDGAREAAVPGVLHGRLGMALGSHDDVGLVARHRVEELRQHPRRNVEVAVQEQHVAARRRAEAGLERVALPRVLRDQHRPARRARGVARGERFGIRADRLRARVRAAVVHRHELVAETARVEAGGDGLQVLRDGRAEVVDGQDDAQKIPLEDLPRVRPVQLLRHGVISRT